MCGVQVRAQLGGGGGGGGVNLYGTYFDLQKKHHKLSLALQAPSHIQQTNQANSKHIEKVVSMY